MWRLDRDAALPLWRPDPGPAHAVLAFSTRRGGVSAAPFESLNVGRSAGDDPASVTANRRAMLVALDLDPEVIATAGQVHGTRVVEVTGPGPSRDTDALLTRVPGVALAVTTADCVPIFFVAPGAVCVAHSGWRGTAAGMPRVALEAICAASGTTPDRVVAHLGPGIGRCCYAVGPEVAGRFPSTTVTRIDGSLHLDLHASARIQLQEAGMRPDAIHVVDACTACESDWYFSHRRDAGRTGRHWAVAALRHPAGRRGSGV